MDQNDDTALDFALYVITCYVCIPLKFQLKETEIISKNVTEIISKNVTLGHYAGAAPQGEGSWGLEGVAVP